MFIVKSYFILNLLYHCSLMYQIFSPIGFIAAKYPSPAVLEFYKSPLFQLKMRTLWQIFQKSLPLFQFNMVYFVPKQALFGTRRSARIF